MLALSAGAPAMAQDYPNRPVNMVVAAAAGGPIDVFARIMAERMSPDRSASACVMENVGGGGGTLGGQRVARAEPDGYTTLARHDRDPRQSATADGDKPLYDPVQRFHAAWR